MNGQNLFKGLICMILTALLLVGCSAPANESPVVTFDGSSCTYVGPSELTAGKHQFAVKNLSDGNLSIYIFLIEEGYNFQDVEDKVKEDEHKAGGGANQNWADWWNTDHSSFVTWEIDEKTGDELYTLEMRKEGNYAIIILNNTEATFWACAPLKVTEAPSE